MGSLIRQRADPSRAGALLTVHSALLPAALLATAALLAGCSSSPGQGPLGNGGDGGQQCVPGKLGHTLTMGLWGVYNTSKKPAIVTSVGLPDPHGLAITKTAWLVPDTVQPGHIEGVGVQEDYPPVSWPTWSQRQAIPGAVARPHISLSIVFGLTRTTGRTGRSAGPVITYTAGGTTYTIREQTSLVVTNRHSCPA
jgi:hypothetical protein